ncbi:MAG TPA: hypothetical protein VIY86_13535, partial [Pirellulaceae bacterium]
AVFTISVFRPGDFDQDGDLDLNDVDALTAAIAAGSSNLQFDTNGDGLVNVTDLQNWILNIKRTVMGDANLDFVTDGSDFNIWNQNKFTSSTKWSKGNFNADGFVDGSDFNIWNQNKFTSGSGSRPISTSAPMTRDVARDTLLADTRARQRGDLRERRAIDDVFAADDGVW